MHDGVLERLIHNPPVGDPPGLVSEVPKTGIDRETGDQIGSVVCGVLPGQPMGDP